MANIGCTPEHPGYIGRLPADPQDASFINLVGKVPYIGNLAAALMATGFRGGHACFEDKTKNYRTGWKKEITVGVIAIALIVMAILLVIFY